MIKTFSTEHLNRVFAEEGKYEAYKNLMFDAASKADIYDEDGNVVPKNVVNDKIRKVVFEVLGIDENSDKRARKRAIKKHHNELFEVIEDVIDTQITAGFRDSEWFNDLVEMRSLNLGDSQEFFSKDDVMLTVCKVSGDHHDLTIQRLGYGESYTIPVSSYAIKVGTDIDLYLAGRIDWSELIDAVTRAFVQHVQTTMFTEVSNASAKLPSQFKGTGQLQTADKTNFDEILENVSAANDGAPVYIYGTKTALKKLTGLADVDWASNSQKDSIANTGRLGSYEGTVLVEIPQRFANKTDFKKLFPNDKLYIFASTEDKPVKFVDVGDTEILERTEKGDYMDDTMSYEVQRSMGVGTVIGRYFGEWTITA